MRIARDIITCMAKPLARSLACSLALSLTLSGWGGWMVRWFSVLYRTPLAHPPLQSAWSGRGCQQRRQLSC